MALSEEAKAIRNAKARAYYAQNKEKYKAANERYFERLAIKEKESKSNASPVYSWIVEHQPKPKTVGIFYGYDVVKQATGVSLDVVVKEINRIKGQLFGMDIAVQVGVKSNGERGIRVISLK